MSQMNQTATYRRVAILRPGEYMDMTGQRVVFSIADLARIAENYDPAYHAAPVNIDHAADGPALGVISDLSWDGGFLSADIARVPPDVADDIDAGRYPFRSAEVYADLEGRGPYLRAVALLGARPPAVKGLPAMPLREANKAIVPSGAAVPGRHYVTKNGGHGGPPHLNGQSPRVQKAISQRRGQQAPRIIHIISEVYMSQDKANRSLDNSSSADAVPADGDAVRLAEENQRLAEENRRLKRAEHRRSVACFLAELRDLGKLTPAMEQAGLGEALVTSEEQQIVVALGEGRQLPLSEVLREVLKALPISYGTSELAPPGELLPELSPEEREIAAQLGLSEQEYAEIKES